MLTSFIPMSCIVGAVVAAHQENMGVAALLAGIALATVIVETHIGRK